MFWLGDVMTLDPYTDRLARVRHRFMSSLAGKIEEAYAAIPSLSDSAPAAASAVEAAYRCIHNILGVAPTVGLPATGRAAHDAEDVLRLSQRDKRGLTDGEILAFKKRLDALREAASRELQSLQSVREPQ
jgi:HPt (histidine-containing phosphotransfer) domain-containing protein